MFDMLDTLCMFDIHVTPHCIQNHVISDLVETPLTFWLGLCACVQLQGWQKHFSFGQANYSGGNICQCWTGKWTGMVEWTMKWTRESKNTFLIAIPNSSVAICLLTYS